ncbi:hypothetical protein OH77DRAFT_1237757 [Trametes cingulata]|nr:hypothetical protein OH77DRAFT_1237757 [Trametes cingulata]
MPSLDAPLTPPTTWSPKSRLYHRPSGNDKSGIVQPRNSGHWPVQQGYLVVKWGNAYSSSSNGRTRDIRTSHAWVGKREPLNILPGYEPSCAHRHLIPRPSARNRCAATRQGRLIKSEKGDERGAPAERRPGLPPPHLVLCANRAHILLKSPPEASYRWCAGCIPGGGVDQHGAMELTHRDKTQEFSVYKSAIAMWGREPQTNSFPAPRAPSEDGSPCVWSGFAQLQPASIASASHALR